MVTWANALTKKQDTIPDQPIVNIDELLWTLILFLLLLLQNDLLSCTCSLILFDVDGTLAMVRILGDRCLESGVRQRPTFPDLVTIQ